ncbi:Kinase suppressor of Ras 2 [Varanus komodoensis]|nr:Kinase suppressor of Ras 2 [Varanus komodoensis]
MQAEKSRACAGEGLPSELLEADGVSSRAETSEVQTKYVGDIDSRIGEDFVDHGVVGTIRASSSPPLPLSPCSQLRFSSSSSLCKGRTLYSVVRDAKIVLDVNKTRQIAQEIVKGMGYLHAKGILHKDLKSKNVFYDNGKVVITDFGLFSISGVLQAGRYKNTMGSLIACSFPCRRENKLRIQNGWLCHLAPEIIRQLSPDTEEDKLPFSKHSDVFALGTIWYELHAREWPFKTQPAEAIIWQVGHGMKPNLSQLGMGKEISDILHFCWAYEQEERPTFTKLMEMLEKLPKRNRRLSHPGHFWKSAE